MTLRILALVLAIAASGCVDRSHGGYFDAHAFYHVRGHYRVRYAPGETEARSLLGSQWRPINILTSGDVPVELRHDPWLDIDRAPIDTDGDDRPEAIITIERHDLIFEHRGDGARILVRSLPLSRAMADRSLDVLVHDLLERASRSTVGGAGGAVEVMRTLYEGPATVDDAEAYQAVFEGAALGTDGNVIATTTDRAFLVVVRSPRRWYSGYEEGSGLGLPMVVAFWLVARREHFDQHVPELRALLDRTDFRPR